MVNTDGINTLVPDTNLHFAFWRYNRLAVIHKKYDPEIKYALLLKDKDGTIKEILEIGRNVGEWKDGKKIK